MTDPGERSLDDPSLTEGHAASRDLKMLTAPDEQISLTDPVGGG